MKTTVKAQESAQHIQTILEHFWESNSENMRLRAEVHILKLQLRKTGQPADDVFAGIVAEVNGKQPTAEQLCPDCNGSMVQMGRTVSCTACPGMFVVNDDGTLGNRLSASVAASYGVSRAPQGNKERVLPRPPGLP